MKTDCRSGRFHLETLEGRCMMSVAALDGPAAFAGLDVAIEQFQPTDPHRIESPVFAANFGAPTPETVPALTKLNAVLERLAPTDPSRTVSPIFFGLSRTDA